MKEQNYSKVADYTKRAMQLFAKRTFAKQIIDILARPKHKKEIPIETESDPGIDDSISNDLPMQRKNPGDEIEGKNTNFRFNRQILSQLRESNTSIQIGKVCYGDFIGFEVRGLQNYRVAVILDSVKMFTSRELPRNSFNTNRMCFQVCCPSKSFNWKGEPVTSESMVCLKSVFTGSFLQLASKVTDLNQFGYEITLGAKQTKETIFRIVSKKSQSKEISTDHQVCLVSYYSPELYWSIEESSLQKLVDRLLISSYEPTWFHITLSQTSQKKPYPFFYIKSVGINKFARAEFIPFGDQVIRKEFNKLELEEGDQTQVHSYSQIFSFYELGDTRLGKNVILSPTEPLTLYHIWQIDKDCKNEGSQCRIINLITGQSLAPEAKQPNISSGFCKRQSIFQLKQQQSHRNHYSILNDQSQNLCAIYQGDDEQYILKFQQDTSLKSSAVGKTCIVQFEFIEIDSYRAECLVQLLECFQLLKNNYPFLQKWGFRYLQHEFKLTYSVTLFKKHLLMMRRKINEIMQMIQKLKMILQNSDYTFEVKDMTRQARILELLILYCKIINLKIDSHKYRDKQIFQLATAELKPLNDKLLSVISLLAYDNKGNSEIIIEHSIFFNHILTLLPNTIGPLLQQSIKNLCQLTKKISKQELVLFQWTRLVDYITSTNKIDVQRRYIDIIAEVVIDPNDIGITPYQNKIKEQLFNKTKKKIFPKYLNHEEKGPMVKFQYVDFPIDIQTVKSQGGKCFQLRQLFYSKVFKPEYETHIDYLCSLLKLMRNLCKDRNRKMPRVVEDYGLTQNYMYSVFRDTEIGWSLIARFLDLYCSMYLIQDPFVSFEKRQVKCYAWWKIEEIDFNKKTAILFNQFTEEQIAQDKLKQFDLHVLPLLNAYFEELNSFLRSQDKNISSTFDIKRYNRFQVFVCILYEIMNYGYLNQKLIYKYLRIVLQKTEFILAKECCLQKRKKLVKKVVQLCTLAEEISTIIEAMSLIKKVYVSFNQPFQPSRQKIIDTFEKALDYKCKSNEQVLLPKVRKTSMKISRNIKKSSNEQVYTVHEHPFEKEQEQNLDIIKFTLNQMIDSKNGSFQCMMQSSKLLGLLELISERGERICAFLGDLLIFTNPQEETLYLEYSGITPIGLMGDSGSSSRRLLNVTKVKELVDRITEETVDSGEQDRKKQKIYELNNLLSKILSNLQQLKSKNYQLFGFCQLLLQKLKMHSILAHILKFHEYDCYQEVIEYTIKFYCQFVEGNSENLEVMAQFFPELTKRYSYKRLPSLLSVLFAKVKSQTVSFDMIFSNVGKKMKQTHKQILYECIYKILKVCPVDLFLKIKGQVIYTLTSLQQFVPYIKGQTISTSFIKLLCFAGYGVMGVHQKIKQHIKKSDLLKGLQSEKVSYELKWVYLRLYHFLYVETQTKIDEMEVILVVENIFIHELKYLPAACRVGALSTISQTQAQAQKTDPVHEFKEKLQQQFEQLLNNFHETLTASQQESYFNYLLNSQEESQFSMLVFLERFIKKFEIHSIDSLVAYIFKLISFMDRIHFKEATYQNRILRKLYDICQVFDEKYNRRRRALNTKLEYTQAYDIVEKFYRRVVGIIQKENITYAQILKCAGVNNSELSRARSASQGSKLVHLSYFLKFINDLLGLVNNRQQCLEISDAIIKQFFNQVKEQTTQKLNLLSFLQKMIDMLEYEKNNRLVRQINQNQRSDSSLSLNHDQSNSFVNRKLIKSEIRAYIETYRMLLAQTMVDRIKRELLQLLQKRKEIECTYGCHSLFDLHRWGESFRITELVAMVIIQDMSPRQCKNQICREVQNYLKFCLKQAYKRLDENLLILLQRLYEKVKEYQAIPMIFAATIKQMHGLVSDLILYENKLGNFAIIQQFYRFQGTLLHDNAFDKETQTLIGVQTSKLLINCFNNLFATPSKYWCICCNLLFDSLLNNFLDYQSIAVVLSSFKQFKLQIIEYIRQHLPKTSQNISKFCKQCSIFNKFCQLLIKLRAKGLKAEIMNIIGEWPFDELFEFVQKNYSKIVMEKGLQAQECQRQQGCSFQFCNNGKLTSVDCEKADTLINILSVILIGGELNRQSQSEQLKSKVVQHYRNWSKGSIQHIPQRYMRMFGTVHRVSIKMNINSSNLSTIYFSLPFLDKFQKVQFEEIENQEIKSFKKDNYLENIYKFSYLIQNKIQHLDTTEHNILSKNYQKVYGFLQTVFITYLIFSCIIFIRYDNSIPLLLHTLNSILLVLKVALFWWDVKEFISERRLLLGIQYEEYTIFWKYARIFNGCVLLVCYFLLYFWMEVYPVALMLQLYNVKYCQDIVNYFLKSMHTIFSLVIPSQILLLGCSFYIVNYKGYNGSVFQVFVKINYEAMKLESVTLMVDDPDSYPLLKLIPFTIPLFTILYLLFKTLFISSVVYEIIRKGPNHKHLGDVCKICDASRMSFEEKGLNFSNHIQREHSIWSYIYFFIYMRKNKEGYLLDGALANKIQNGQLQLLKLGINYQ